MMMGIHEDAGSIQVIGLHNAWQRNCERADVIFNVQTRDRERPKVAYVSQLESYHV